MENHVYGYARVSSGGQDLTIQREALAKAGCQQIREEKVSGTSLKGRKELELLLGFMRKGDTLVVTRIDRLARSFVDFVNITDQLSKRGIMLRTTDQRFDTATPEGKMLLGMLGLFAEFETNIRKERQAEGIAKAKEAGIYKGGKPRIDRTKVQELKAAGQNPSQISRELGIDRSSVYRVLGER
ncbi:MAG: recombinase family protein [Rhodomicrobium sp.]